MATADTFDSGAHSVRITGLTGHYRFGMRHMLHWPTEAALLGINAAILWCQ
jgi:hypothetical protein